MPRYNVPLSVDLLERVEALAHEYGSTRSQIIRMALKVGVDALPAQLTAPVGAWAMLETFGLHDNSRCACGAWERDRTIIIQLKQGGVMLVCIHCGGTYTHE